MKKVLFAKMFGNAQPPTRAHSGDAGYDLYALNGFSIPAGGTVRVPTGICVALPEGTYGRVASRSGLASQGITTQGGVIDAGYRGQIEVILYNSTQKEFTRESTEKAIAQLIVEYVVPTELEKVPLENLSSTERGDGGFGSTEKNK